MTEPGAGDRPARRRGPVAVLVGLPGAGKTTVGRKLARRLGVPFHDTDLLVEELAGRGIPEIFATAGERAFRELEERVIAEALTSAGGIVSLGGGAVLSPATRERLRGHNVIHLTIGVAEGVRRSRGPGRPLLAGTDPTAAYQRLHTERGPLYREVAWVSATTERRGSGKVVADLVEHLRGVVPEVVAAAPETGDTDPVDAAETEPVDSGPVDALPVETGRVETGPVGTGGPETTERPDVESTERNR